MNDPKIKCNIIVAVFLRDEKAGIGINGEIPWEVPDDMKRFKELTMDSVVIMGKNTWYSIPSKFRPLRNRVNVVVSSTMSSEETQGYKVVGNLPEALEYAQIVCKEKKIEKIFIMGGESIYNEMIEHHAEEIGKLYITFVREKALNHIDQQFDTYFPLKKYTERGFGIESFEEFTDHSFYIYVKNDNTL